MRKTFLSIMMVAIAATISVVFTTCSHDNENNEKVNMEYYYGKWFYIIKKDGSFDPDFILEIRTNGTYYYSDPNRIFNGNHKIFARTDTTGVFTYLYNGNVIEV